VGIISYWLVYDFPDSATFLSDVDRARVIRRLADDQQASAHYEKFDMQFFWESVKDWKTYCFAVVYMGADGSLYAFSLFLPTIIKKMGYTSTRANLLTVPPYAAAAIMTIAVGWYGDRTRRRGLCNIVMAMVAMVGFIMLISTRRPAVQYLGTFLGAMGIYPAIANTIAWCSNNIEGVYKRGVTLGIVIG
jgi:nitrate/nitrite transporter NarK